ncbi:type II toxin-antitoxin system VapC family toxin [Kribbella pittospori]|uniref:Ribonuclease VapC n=1 Tax=Kribbella pittospori TaxID=722689 RepID=A0A4R0JVI5_9ACTN|nr:type II toxin-antitoxin system VapC family toxin [Kribbella pittospori]TCC51523.1 type II toxin-antitoxin system VapC family toxin [Kribbella pittospori]
MTFLLDTNVISELRKPLRVADGNVRSWAAACRPSDLHLSVITILELEIGIGRLERKDRTQGQRLRRWLEGSVLAEFAGRILPVDLAVARRAAQLQVPDPRPDRDTLIAATAEEHAMTVVTRNLADFEPLNVPLINPWLPA